MLSMVLFLGHPAPLQEPAGVRVSAYELEVRFEPAQGTLRGTAIVHIDSDELRSEELVFTLHGELRVESVSAGGRALAHEGESVFQPFDYALVAREERVTLGDADLSDGLRITYSGPFHPSRARSPSDYMRIDADGVFLRGYYYSAWFPIFLAGREDSHVVDFGPVTLDVPAAFEPVFVGTRLESRVHEGRRTSTWEARCELSEVQCTARPFDLHEYGELFVYALPGVAADETPAALAEFVPRLTAAYRRAYGAPETAQIHVLAMPEFGDIASGNTVGMAPDTWRAFPRAAEARVTLAHELVHAFVWVPIERSDPLFALVVEGFPSYFHLPLLEEILGAGFHDQFLARAEREYLARRSSGSAGPEVALSAIRAEEIGLYKDRFVLNDRALLFLAWLRRTMGMERFGAFAHALFGRERLDRPSFERAVLEVLPDSAPDLALWLDSSELPDRLRLGH